MVALGLDVTLHAEIVYEGPPLGRSWQLRPVERGAGWSTAGVKGAPVELCYPHAFILNAGDAGSLGRSCIMVACRSHEKAS